MIVSINQPAYLPWLGYFHRVALSDLHIVLDHVQFEKNSFVNRNKIRTADGWCWLTVPVITKGQFGNLNIRSLEINNSIDWRKKHWNSIKQNYAKTPFFDQYAPFFESIYEREWAHLAELCDEMNKYILKELGIETPHKLSSDMNPEMTKSDLVLELCGKVGAKTYISGSLGKGYLEEDKFRDAGVTVLYQCYDTPPYSDYKGRVSEYSLSVIDLLFNKGPESKEILMHPYKPGVEDASGSVHDIALPDDRALFLRNVEPGDCEMFFEWANDAVTRELSFSPDKISWEAHCSWFKEKLADEGTRIYVGLDEKLEPVGQIRFGKLPGEEYGDDEVEVDVHIAPGKRSMGYGSRLISSAMQDFFAHRYAKKIHAFVRPENTASVHVFEKVGFKNIGECVIKGFNAIHFIRKHQ